jgi:hypothetical protein
MRLDPQLDTVQKIAQRIQDLDKRLKSIEDIETTPNDAAAMLLCCGGDDAQVIPNDSWTYVDFDFDSGGTWPLGLEIEDGHEDTTGIDKIWVQGIPAETVVFFTMECYWAADATGIRGMRWLAGDGSMATYLMPAISGDGTAYSAIHWRRQSVGNEWYSMMVYQNSGAPLDLNFLNFGAWRIR